MFPVNQQNVDGLAHGNIAKQKEGNYCPTFYSLSKEKSSLISAIDPTRTSTMMAPGPLASSAATPPETP